MSEFSFKNSVRHLGKVRFYTTSPKMRRYLLNEMLSRVIKNRIRKLMREKTAEITNNYLHEEPFKSIILKNFNMLLQQDPQFWSQLKTHLESKFSETSDLTESWLIKQVIHFDFSDMF